MDIEQNPPKKARHSLIELMDHFVRFNTLYDLRACLDQEPRGRKVIMQPSAWLRHDANVYRHLWRQFFGLSQGCWRMRPEFLLWYSTSNTPPVALNSIHDYLKTFLLKGFETWPELDIFNTAMPFESEVDVMPWLSVDRATQPFDVIVHKDHDKEADVAMEALSQIEGKEDKLVFSLSQLASIHLQNCPDYDPLASAGMKAALVPELKSEQDL
jgi:hypothetical protein